MNDKTYWESRSQDGEKRARYEQFRLVKLVVVYIKTPVRCKQHWEMRKAILGKGTVVGCLQQWTMGISLVEGTMGVGDSVW